MLAMKPSPWLYTFLRGIERFRPTAYKPTPKDKWTLGFGHTAGVKEGDTCTLTEAEAWLVNDCQWAADEVNKAARVNVAQAQFDAMCSLCFNIGADAFGSSTLVELLNSGAQRALVAGQFLRWDRQHGRKIKGLDVRRSLERARFMTA